MRILQVRFKNLNSLLGEWEIDLTHPAFASDGIFAITGPTGAGKTTILDAICLALYGRTPRLNKVTLSSNEIMSRQTGECFAEVTFETQTGRFRCHWSQHRSRKSPGGKLQNAKHEIANADSGQLFETNIRGVAELIEKATGMDFDRFTRSMLLAQGGFAVFLQAVADDRAPILEQITGTEIYSQISIRVHERRSDERKKQELLQSEFAGMQMLSEADEQQLTENMALKIALELDLNKQVNQKNQAIVWLDGIRDLENDLTLLGEQKQDFLLRQEQFKPELERLERAKKALELTGDYAHLCTLRRELEAERLSHLDCLQALPEQESAVKLEEEALKLSNDNLAQKRTEQQQVQLVIRKVRELDLKLREKEAPINVAKQVIAEKHKALEDLSNKNYEDCRTLKEQTNTFDGIVNLLVETQVDEGLVEHLAGIRNRLDTLRELDCKERDKAGELSTVESQKIKATEVWSDCSTKLDSLKFKLVTAQGSLSQQQSELNTIQAGRETGDWRNILTERKDRKVLLETVSALVLSLTESKRTLSELTNLNETLVVDKETLTLQIKEQIEKQAAFEREMQLLETQLSLLKKIQDFEEARHQLQDGESCPLCGAIDHPFATGNIPVPDKTTAALIRVRTDLKQANGDLSRLMIKQAEVVKDQELISIHYKEYTDKITNQHSSINEGLAVLSIEVTDTDLIEVLQKLRQENEENFETTLKVVQVIDQHDKEILALRESLEKTREAVSQLERDTQAATHTKESAEQAVDRLKNDSALLAVQYQKVQDDALDEVSLYGIKNLPIDTLDQVKLQLTRRREQFLARQKQRIELEKLVSTLTLRTQHQAGQIKTSEIELKNQQDVLSSLMRDQESLTQERQVIFGDKNTEEEEVRHFNAIEEAERSLENRRLKLNSVTQELGNLKSRIETLEKSIVIRVEQSKIGQEKFRTQLSMCGFTDEDGYLTACLSEIERNNLMLSAEQLTTEQTELNARSRDKTSLSEVERLKQITDLPRTQLAEELDKLLNDLKILQQDVGGIRQKLIDNDSLRFKQLERIKAIEAQKRECFRWDNLHALIGSGDGKKYRNFAQGLTFEMMIGHANRQLQKMSDRYLLIRDETQPLELNVVDNYQAGEIRSTKNLSGGESFIVSLSLALGLSHMASKNVRVDSLFLDEGFGTLDEEALETALETLAGLQQDGKMIGVISHVSALKERIGTQIQVSPKSGGRSVISGPGCCQLN
jgi:exonuclease SbcC